MDPHPPAPIGFFAVPAEPGEAPLPKPQQLTSGAYDEENAMWSPDGSQIYLEVGPHPQAYYEVPRDSIYVVPSKGGTTSKLFQVEGDIGAPALSREGKHI